MGIAIKLNGKKEDYHVQLFRKIWGFIPKEDRKIINDYWQAQIVKPELFWICGEDLEVDLEVETITGKRIVRLPIMPLTDMGMAYRRGCIKIRLDDKYHAELPETIAHELAHIYFYAIGEEHDELDIEIQLAEWNFDEFDECE